MQIQTSAIESNRASEELVSEDLARALVYRLLARLFRAPATDELLNMIGRLDLVQAVDKNTTDENSLYAAWKGLQTAAGNASVAALDDEFHALFIGISRGEIMPYASWYLTGFLMEKPLAELRTDLQALGLEQQGDVVEPEDHMAALCEAMVLLIENADYDVTRQRAFFNDHITPWMSQLFVDLQTARTAQFYRSVASFGKKFMEIETGYMAITV